VRDYDQTWVYNRLEALRSHKASRSHDSIPSLGPEPLRAFVRVDFMILALSCWDKHFDWSSEFTVGAYKSATHVICIVQTPCLFYFDMTSQHNTSTPTENQQHDWKEVEDHKLVTDFEDDKANAMAKFMEHEWREVARKVVEAEQWWKVEEAWAEVQRRKEVHGDVTHQTGLVQWTWKITSISNDPGAKDEHDGASS